MRINIVIDNSNNWFNDYILELIEKIRKQKHTCQLYRTVNKITKNSDITFFLGCEKYISKKNRKKSRFNIVVHASNLPKGKGMSPATWQILKGKNKIPITLFEVSDKIDSGNYYLKDVLVLDGTELIADWQKKMYIIIERMIIKFIKNINTIKSKQQKGKETFFQRRFAKDSELDINKSIKDQINLLRVADNERYPAFFMYKGKQYIIKIYNKN